MKFLQLRKTGYDTITGKGIEIGAFEHPAKLENVESTEYCDVITPEEARELFPEIAHIKLKEVDHIIDLNADWAGYFEDEVHDYIIFNHVVEHLVDPIGVIADLVRTLKPGGKIALAAPDKEHTFDRNRPETSFDTLKVRHDKRLKDVDRYAYMDMARYVHPEFMTLPKNQLDDKLQIFKDRREHLNIWTSRNFKHFLIDTVKLKKLPIEV